MHIVVVGAGFAGLSAACHLVGAGHEATLLDERSAPGGVAQQRVTPDGVLDMGPTVVTLPQVIDAVFAAAGADRSDFVELMPLDPLYRACFADGSSLRVRANEDDMADELRALVGPHAVDQWSRLRRWLIELRDLEWDAFIDREWRSPLDMLRVARPGLGLIRRRAFSNYHGAIGRFLEDDRLRQAFSYQASYVGGSPFQLRALFALITYCDAVVGAVHPRGGPHALAAGLARAFEAAGGHLRLGCTASDLDRDRSGQVRGVVLEGGERIAADRVVLAMPVARAYRTLLARSATPWRVRTARYGQSCVVWSTVVDGEAPSDAAHHNVHFSGRWRDEIRAKDAGRDGGPDATSYVHLPGVTEPGRDPEGGVVMYALEMVPNTSGQVDWPADGGAARDRLRGLVGAHGYPTAVRHEAWADPSTWLAAGQPYGTPFSVASHFTQSGALRPGCVDRRLPGVAFAGSSTAPGVGIPMVMISGRIAADRVLAPL